MSEKKPKKSKKPVGVVIARTSFRMKGNRAFTEGQAVRADDPAVKAHPNLFRDAIETATAEPGETRTAGAS